MDELDEIDAYA